MLPNARVQQVCETLLLHLKAISIILTTDQLQVQVQSRTAAVLAAEPPEQTDRTTTSISRRKLNQDYPGRASQHQTFAFLLKHLDERQKKNRAIISTPTTQERL